MKSQLKQLALLIMPWILACQQQAPVARLQISPQALTLPYPHSTSLELNWLPLSPLDVAASELFVFVHLIDPEGNVQRTFDHPFPETWAEGSEVTYPLDLHQSAIAPPLAPGSYDLTVGLYAVSGRRWPLDVEAVEVDDEEYAMVEVTIPYPVMATPRFDFSDAWQASQETGFRQIVAHRWLSEKNADLLIWGIDRRGEAVLSFTIPQLQGQELRLRTRAPGEAPTVAVESDCGSVRGGLSGYGSHEIRVSVPAAATGQRCTVRFSPSFYFINSDSSRRYSALLESVTWVPGEVDDGDAMASTHRRITRSPQDHGVSLSRAATPETIILRNVGDQIVVDPRVIVNRRKDWFSIDSMLAEILEPGSSDGEKAMAIWEFLVANRYHDIPIAEQVEMHDPVRLLNVYGYGFCDDAANSFMMLARKAGLPARIWNLTGHVVSEAFYDGDWRMFDADGEVFYRSESDGTVAGVKRLSRKPDLIRRHPSPNPLYHDTEHLVDLYTSRGDNQIVGWYRGRSRHVMAFDLRPGESILRSRQNWGLYVASSEQTEPAVYGNGRFSFEPVLRDGLFRLGATAVTGVRVEAAGEGRRIMVFAAEGDPARLTYPFSSPYPLLSGRVRISGELRGNGTVELELSADGEQWSPVWASSDAGEVDVQVSLDPFLSGDSGRPVYSYHLSMVYAADTEGSQWRVETLRFDNDFQLAPHALPSFDQGENEVLYVDAGEGEREIELVFGYGELDVSEIHQESSRRLGSWGGQPPKSGNDRSRSEMTVISRGQVIENAGSFQRTPRAAGGS